MLMVHDIWVNWYEGAVNRFDIPYFHEWRKGLDLPEQLLDKTQLIDEIPLLYVDHELYDYIADEEREIPKIIQEAIYDKTKIKVGIHKFIIHFAAVITDGEEVMAFKCEDGLQTPAKKTRLIPRQERQVLEVIEPFEAEYLHFTPGVKRPAYLTPSVQLSKQHMIGLTRKERNLKKLAMAILEDLYLNEHKEQILYWFVEWNPSVYEYLAEWTFDEVWEQLVEELKTGWSDDHTRFVEKISAQSFYYKKKFEECFIPRVKKNV